MPGETVRKYWGVTTVPLKAIFVPQLDPVAPLFPIKGANWNDYVKGNTWSNGSDEACAGAAPCFHAGEVRVVEATGLSSCDGLTAEDDRKIFNWICDDNTGTAQMISTGLAQDKNLADVLDFANKSIRLLKVDVYQDGVAWRETPYSAWWSNPVQENNTGGDLNVASTIYMVNSDPELTYWRLAADRTALVIRPDISITGPVNGITVAVLGDRELVRYLCIEGRVGANVFSKAKHGLLLNNLQFSVLRNIEVRDIADSAISFYGTYNRFDNVTAGFSGSGLRLSSGSTNNVFNRITTSGNGSDGIQLGEGADDNRFIGVTAMSNRGAGVSFNGRGRRNAFSGLMLGNNNTGLSVASGALNNTFADLTAVNNAIKGVNISSSPANWLEGLTLTNNPTSIDIQLSERTTLSRAAISGKYNIGLRIVSSDNVNVTDAASANGNIGIIFTNSSFNRFWNKLYLGNNFSVDCTIVGGTDPGLDSNCISGLAQTVKNVSLAKAWVGKLISDDPVNTSDTDGGGSVAQRNPAVWLTGFFCL